MTDKTNALRALADRFICSTGSLPDEWQDWREEFHRDMRKLLSAPEAPVQSAPGGDAVRARDLLVAMRGDSRRFTVQERGALTAAIDALAAAPTKQTAVGDAVAEVTLSDANVGMNWPDAPLRLTGAGRSLPPGTYMLYTAPPAEARDAARPSTEQGVTDAMADLKSHRHDWRNACEIALNAAQDAEDADYWRHQIATLDRIDAAFAAHAEGAPRDASWSYAEMHADAQADKFCDANCVWTDHHADCPHNPAREAGAHQGEEDGR